MAYIDDEPVVTIRLEYFISIHYGMNYLHRFVKLKYVV